MSPGTSVAAATSCHLPSRIAVASGASPFLSAAVLPEFERSIEEQQRRDDGEVVPMPDDGRNDRRGLDHVGVRAGEVPDDLAEQADLFFDEGVGSVFGEPFARLGAAQSLLGLDASWARTFSTGILSRSIAACDPTSGARVADCRATADMDCSLERVHGNLEKEFFKITRLAYGSRSKNGPWRRILGAARKRRSRIWLVVRLLDGALESVRHRQLDVDGARGDR